MYWEMVHILKAEIAEKSNISSDHSRLFPKIPLNSPFSS